MAPLPFPRTIQQAAEAPWCDDIDDDRKQGGDCIFIEIKYSWLPERFPEANFCSAHGPTFRSALADLRHTHWNWLRDPATGEPVSATPEDWVAGGFDPHPALGGAD